MTPKYSEKALLRVCYTMGIVIIAIIGGVAYCIGKVLDKIV